MKKSYFYAILKNFIMTLFVPLFTVVLIYLYTSANIRNQIEISSQNSLRQFLSAVDTIAGEMGDICIAMVENEECKRYAASWFYTQYKKQNEILNVIDALDIYSQERYYDVFVYYPQEDRIISATKASTTSWHYYNSYYSSQENWGKEGDEWEAFLSLLNCSSMTPSFMTIEKDGKDYLCVVEKQYYYSNEKYNYVTVVVLRPQFLEKMIGEGMLSLDTLFMMFDAEGKVILSENSMFDELCLTEEDLQHQARTISIGKEKYMLWVQESDNFRGYYATAVPVQYFNEQLYMLNILCGSGILICIIVSIYIAWRGSLRSYNPFEELYRKLSEQENKMLELDAQNELEYIELLFERTREEKERLHDRILNKKNLSKDMLLLSLIEGTGKSTEETKKLLEETGILFPERFFCVCYIQAEREKNLDTGIMIFIIQNILEEQISHIGKGCLIPISESRSCLLINCANDVELEQILSFVSDGKIFIEKNFEIHLTMGISSVYEGIHKISSCYKEAVHAFEYRYFYGNGTLIQYDRIKEKGFSYDVFMKNNLSILIMDYVSAGDGEKNTLEEFCNRILKLYGIDTECSLDTMQCFKFEMLNAMYKIMTSVQYSGQEKKEKLEQLLVKPSLEEFLLYWMELLEELCRTNHLRNQKKDICLLAKNYIEDHYGDADLSLELLGEKLNCSSSYLSRKFKEKWAVSMIEYITEVRIDRAKELLEDTDITVQEIAELTGYLSSPSFVKTFKKKTGTTPGNYRKTIKDLKKFEE